MFTKYMFMGLLAGLFYGASQPMALAQQALQASNQAAPAANQQRFSGMWLATWQHDPATFPYDTDPATLRMEGHLAFMPNGAVTVTALGFEGCVFSTDTVVNALNYAWQDNKLLLINAKEAFTMDYEIMAQSANSITLSFMQDITLTLRRPD